MEENGKVIDIRGYGSGLSHTQEFIDVNIDSLYERHGKTAGIEMKINGESSFTLDVSRQKRWIGIRSGYDIALTKEEAFDILYNKEIPKIEVACCAYDNHYKSGGHYSLKELLKTYGKDEKITSEEFMDKQIYVLDVAEQKVSKGIDSAFNIVLTEEQAYDKLINRHRRVEHAKNIKVSDYLRRI